MSISIQEQSVAGAGYLPIVVHLQPVVSLSDDQLYEFSRINRDLRIERNQFGELNIMPPAGGESSEQNSEITMQLRLWAKSNGTGAAFDSSGGFRLPNGAVRSPDAAWVSNSRLKTLTRAQRKKFIPLCPDFVVELRSETDGLRELQEKMREYLENGSVLGLLIDPIDPEEKQVHVYRPRKDVLILDDPRTVSCEPELPGFELDMHEIW